MRSFKHDNHAERAAMAQQINRFVAVVSDNPVVTATAEKQANNAVFEGNE